MLDRDVPPEVVEGEAGGAEEGARPTVAGRIPAHASDNLWQAAFTALPWTTATVPR
jgi:hypothetical protein